MLFFLKKKYHFQKKTTYIYFPYNNISSTTPSENLIQKWPGDSIKVLFNTPVEENVPHNLSTGWPGLYNGDPTSDDYNPLGWYSYKIVVKQTEQEYYLLQ